jgi:hypothetical protein
VFEKAYFQILFLSAKDSKKGNRIEFSPPSKIEKRTCSIQKFFTELKKNSTKFQNILCVSVAKRGDLEIPTKSALLFFVRGEKRRKSLIFLLGGKRVFTIPLTRNTLSTNVSTNITTVDFPYTEECGVFLTQFVVSLYCSMNLKTVINTQGRITKGRLVHTGLGS